ncbi:MAG: hypothetical protein NTU41_13425 [Chloroflexi bacterium]|nr:hypothetical protein [Chloroflexota bacterium]
MAVEDELESQGWKPATVTGGDHLRRTLELYHEAGFETHLLDATPVQYAECAECYRASGEKMYQVYTRMKTRQSGV